MKIPISLLLLSALCLPRLHAADAPPKPAPQRTVIPAATLAQLEAHTDIPYARYGDRELQLDLYRPKERGAPLPAIVCLHGGGWFKGTRANIAPLAQALAARGFVTVTISYRLSGEQKFPAQIEDGKAAVRWLRANAAKHGIEPTAIGVTGLSAGGHLAALLATSGGVKELEGNGGHADQSSTVQAAVAMGAQSDLQTDRIRTLSSAPGNPHYRPFLGGSLDAVPQTYALASPRHHLDKSDPPLLFMAGEMDDPSTRADETREDLVRLGIETGFVVIPEGPHAFLGQQRHFDLAVEKCAEFFGQHLRGSAKAR